MRYAVGIRYYDSGRIESYIKPCDHSQAGSFEFDMGIYDLYIDVFDSRYQAESYYKKIMGAVNAP